MMHGAGGKFEWSWFYPWVLGPYLILGTLFATIGAKTKHTRVASLLTAIAVGIGATYLYLDAIFINVSSTSALIYVFGPLYCLLGGFAVFAAMTFLASKVTAANDT